MTAKTAFIAASDFHRRRQQDARIALIDVRPETEYRRAHVAGARSFPLEELASAQSAGYLSILGLGREQTLYVTSDGPERSARAVALLAAHGLDNVTVLEGGMGAWARSPLPVIDTRRVRMSLQRQALIAAGALILLKVAAGWAVHPVFLGLAALAGAALIWAGATRPHALARLMSRLPWNRPLVARRAMPNP